jgi:hypothetical protein
MFRPGRRGGNGDCPPHRRTHALLGFLARLAAAGAVGGWTPVLIGVSSRIRETIELSGLLPVLDLTDSS